MKFKKKKLCLSCTIAEKSCDKLSREQKRDRKYFTVIATIAPKTFKVLLTVPF
jgi:hypothetical protein